MARINCETREPALYSIAYFYDANPLEIDKFSAKTDISEINTINYDERERILYLFNERFGKPILEIYDYCCLALDYAHNPDGTKKSTN
jgi:hypothetical protein